MEDPRLTYSERLAQRRAEIALRERRHRALGYIQLAAIGCMVALVWLALANQAFSILWAAIPLALFIALFVFHERLLRFTDLRRRAVRYYELGLARLDGAWAGTGNPGEAYLDPAHPYAQDLDLFGKGSLFELLSTARTQTGEQTLAQWLLAPAAPDTIRARQESITELRPRVDLREDLAVLAEEARASANPEALAAWGQTPAILQPGGRILVWALTALGIAGLAALAALILEGVHLIALPGALPAVFRDLFLLAIIANGIFLYLVRKGVEAAVSAVDGAAQDLALLQKVLVRFEQEQFRSPLLASLRAALTGQGPPASRQLRRLGRLKDWLDSREHLMIRALEIFTLWTANFAYAIEAWRSRSGAAVRRWLTSIGELEALCSLANHAFEHPDDVFPQFTPDGPCLAAEGLGHPLIPEKNLIRNDLHLGGDLRLLVVSGSNMSGKSTLLRTAGVNAVLAQAGAPVRARRMVLSPLAVGASIRVTDSLQGRVSRFYAEILRIRRIFELTAAPLPVLFLLDEFLHGTNSHDRRLGAEAVVRRLVQRGAIGLITTHDLALAHIADLLGPHAANVHFEDHIENGRIWFDYLLRPGVVQKSNALELMRSVGLEV